MYVNCPMLIYQVLYRSILTYIIMYYIVLKSQNPVLNIFYWYIYIYRSIYSCCNNEFVAFVEIMIFHCLIFLPPVLATILMTICWNWKLDHPDSSRRWSKHLIVMKTRCEGNGMHSFIPIVLWIFLFSSTDSFSN